MEKDHDEISKWNKKMIEMYIIHKLMGVVLPWEAHPEMEQALEMAGWRYAVLIGITAFGNRDDDIKYQNDPIEYAHLIKKNADGSPIWCEEDAANFVSALSGYPVDICKLWLEYDWV